MSCQHGEDTCCNQLFPWKRFPIVQETKMDDGTLIITTTKMSKKLGYPVKTTKTITKTKDGVIQKTKKLTTEWKDGMILQTITEDGVLKKTTTTKFKGPRNKITNEDYELEKTSNHQMEKTTNDDDDDEELEKTTNYEELEQPALSHNTAPLPMPLRQKKVSLLFNSSLIAFSGWALYRNSKMIFELCNSSFNKILEVIGRPTEMSE